MTNQKTNWKYILLVVILAVVVSDGILWWAKTQEVPFTQLPEITKPEKPSQAETAGWKTYRNEEYGFEIRYPINWGVKEGPASFLGGVGGAVFVVHFTPSNKDNNMIGLPFLIDLEIMHLISKEEHSFQEVKDECKTLIEKDKENFLQPQLEEIIVDKNTILWKVWGKMDFVEEKAMEGCIIHDRDDNFILGMWFIVYGEENIEILNQILSTFRFLK